jgi:dihydroorotate dehydrogenase electron transfer subunit
MNGAVFENKEICPGHYLLIVRLPDSFKTPMPGQFVMVREKGRIDPLLGRPFGVYHFERSRNEATVEILYKVVGKGTLILSRLREGDLLEVFGPYGRAFDVYQEAAKVVFVCGGIGVAPITYLASHYRRQSATRSAKLVCYYGASTAENLVGIQKIKDIMSEVFISTDDGSAGYEGPITQKLAENVSLYEPAGSRIYACGPRPMFKQLSELLAGHTIPCQILMEERMACGIGACLGCTVLLNDAAGMGAHARACIEGPVFDIRDIHWG